jgi:hypothetical protein
MTRNITLLALIIAALLITSCNIDDITGNYKYFEYDLRQIWTSNDTSDTWASGTLVFDFDTLIITGYTGTPPGGQGANQPFNGFTKNTPLKGYSEDGKIFIHDGGSWQPGIPYTVYGTPYDYQKNHLRFTFGTRNETLDKQ